MRINVAGTDPVTGMSFAELAGLSRSMHKSQGFGNFVGGPGRGPTRVEAFQLLDGEPAVHDIMDGIDTSWNRVSLGGDRTGGRRSHRQIQQPGFVGQRTGAIWKSKSNWPRRRLIRSSTRSGRCSIASSPNVWDWKWKRLVPEAEIVPGEVIRLHQRVTEALGGSGEMGGRSVSERRQI